MLGIRNTLDGLRHYLRDRARLSAPMFAVSRVEGMISITEAKLLYDLARRVKEGCIVEVGSYRGRSTVALALGAQAGVKAPIYAIEPHEEFTGALGGKFGPEDRAGFYRAMLRTSAYQRVRLVNLSSEVITPGWKQPVGLLFIDGDHSYAGVKRDFDCWAPHLRGGAVVAFDDATNPHLGPHQLLTEMLRAGWKEEPGVGKVRVIRNKKGTG